MKKKLSMEIGKAEGCLSGVGVWIPIMVWEVSTLYSVSLSRGSDVSTQMRIVSACTHSLCWGVCEPGCAISLAM